MTNTQTAYYPVHRARWGPVAGVLFVVFLVVGIFIGNTPNTNKSPAYILRWYVKNSHKTQLHVSLVITDIAIVLGIFWFGYLRDRFGRTDVGARFAPITLAGAIVFALGGLMFNGVIFALTDEPKDMTASTAQTLNFLQSDVGAAALVVGISIFMWATGFIIWKSRILPRWFAWVTFVLAVAALAGPIGFFAFIATGIWILVAAFMMWRSEERLPISADVTAAVPPSSTLTA